MNVALRRPMTLAEFLEWEERQAFKHEFDGVKPMRSARAPCSARLMAWHDDGTGRQSEPVTV